MLTRRQLLKLGVIGGAAAVLPWERTMVALASGHSGRQFTVPLAVPPVLVPTSSDAATDYYHITMREADLEVWPGQLTRMWTYDGVFPGPTIKARSNRRAVVTQVNQLAVPTSVHLHGAHVSPESDGHPNDVIEPGWSKVYVYPNRQRGSTLWYHDHVMHDTSRNIYMGLAGAYLVSDDAEEELDLPGGDHDIPLVITDRSFAADGSLAFTDSHNSVVGTTILVNGRPWPYLQVAARRYRLRFINASNSREYVLALESGTDLVQIASDGGLLAAPYATPSIRLSAAERAEVVIDFSDVPVGTSVVLKNLGGSAFHGTDDIMRFDVVGQAADPSKLPATLRTMPPAAAAGIVRDVDLGFSDALGLWVIDGKPFDPDRVDATPRREVPEVWRVHNSSGAPHPFHIHLDAFRVLDRDGVPPHPGEAGWKDTVIVDPGETVSLLARFTIFAGPYVYHCHNLAHEDHDMMAQLQLLPPESEPRLERIAGQDRYATAARISESTFSPGVPAAFVATGRDYPDALAGGVAAARRGTPVLLVTRDAVPETTAAELRRLQPGRIVVLGGTGAVAEAVAERLGELAPVERIAGQDRYDTAARISESTFPTGVPVAFVATGADYPDALAGGAAAANRGGPILLVSRDAVPDATVRELRRLQPGRIVVLGGTAAVAEAVAEQLGQLAPVERIAGSDRFATATRVSRDTFPVASRVLVATGRNYPDALAASAAAGAEVPVLLVTRDAVPDVVGEELARLRPTRIVVLGGRQAIGEPVFEALRPHLR
ncbi:MAG TPA: cell wall-binding repeat-containing protein [Egibacteraceae bacterium]|nr:cell wall-binding repeat-containing protein [Egibacteraceae bacterium]